MLSPDLRWPLLDFSSLGRPGGGVAAALRFGERLPAADDGLGRMEGVAGRLVGLWEARLSSSASKSCSDCDWAARACFDGREIVGLVGLDVA